MWPRKKQRSAKAFRVSPCFCDGLFLPTVAILWHVYDTFTGGEGGAERARRGKARRRGSLEQPLQVYLRKGQSFHTCKRPCLWLGLIPRVCRGSVFHVSSDKRGWWGFFCCSWHFGRGKDLKQAPKFDGQKAGRLVVNLPPRPHR